MKKVALALALVAIISGCKDTKPLEREVALTFSDAAITKFQQIAAHSSIAQNTIECLSGESVSIEVEAFSETLSLTLTCAPEMEKKIRQSLLQLMATQTLIAESQDGNSVLAQGVIITLDTKELMSKTYDNVQSLVTFPSCKDRYLLNVASGTMVLESDVANNSGIEQDCLDSYSVGATESDYRQNFTFSFVDGKIELKNSQDQSKTLTFCIKDSGANQCAAI